MNAPHPEIRQSEIIPLSALEVNKGQIDGVPSNPRTIDVVKFRKLKASIKENPEMLSLREVLVYPHGEKFVIIGGNMRYRALKELGYTEAVCKVIPKETTAEQLRAVAIKDNNNFGEWDFDMLANLWDLDELDKWGIDLPPMDTAEAEEDDAKEDGFDEGAAKSESVRTKEGDIFQLGRHRLICSSPSDAEALKIVMGNSKADLLICDIPAEADELQKTFAGIAPHIKGGAPFYLWHDDAARTAVEQSLPKEWAVSQSLVWVKSSIEFCGKDYQRKHESCLYGWTSGGKHYFANRRDLADIFEDEQPNINEMNKAELKEMLSRILSAAQSVSHEDAPALGRATNPTKPLKLLGKQIKNSTRVGEVVLDVFGNMGGTMMAAEQIGRTCYMVEASPANVDAICKRYEDLTGEAAVRLGNFKE